MLLGAAAFALTPGAASAQAGSAIRALPDPATTRLSGALRRLGQEPRSVAALVDAGHASLALEDIEAALGFFNRAQAIAPEDGRVHAGLAAAMVRQGNPLEGLRLFALAEQAGEQMHLHAAERGLAYDLIGDNRRAQQEYAVSLSIAPDPAIIRRLALSQAIAGDQRASEATLLPLLQRSDLPAYRTRAFALAILGRSDEAVAIAETMLPQRLSGRLAPYLRYMPRLTRAQQAAAANLGMFPPAAEIGRDDPALSAYAAQIGGAPAQTPAPRSADQRLVPAGEPMGRRAQDAIPSSAAAVPAQVAVQAPTSPVIAAQLAPPEGGLAEAFSDFSLPAQTAGATEGAVDIATVAPRREAPVRTQPVAPVQPSRHWVQVATGRDRAALAFDWRRIRREASGLLDQSQPHIAAWGQSNRLVAGPFATAQEANQMVTRLKEKDVDAFRFTSAAGEEVRRLN